VPEYDGWNCDFLKENKIGPYRKGYSLTTGDDISRNGPSSIVDLAETDFSVKNSALNNEFSVKNSKFDTRDIVDSVLVGLIAVLTSVAVYQYKGIETLKRVANGSDYQKM